MNLNPMNQRTFSRREALRRTSLGFGSLALAGLMNSRAFGAGLPPGAPHFAPRAKRVIFAYMSGGVSHVDSFDPKPALKARHGQPMPVPVKPTMFNNNGNIMASPWEGQPDPLPPPAPDSSPSVSGNPAEKANSDRKSTRLNSSHTDISRMPSSA